MYCFYCVEADEGEVEVLMRGVAVDADRECNVHTSFDTAEHSIDITDAFDDGNYRRFLLDSLQFLHSHGLTGDAAGVGRNGIVYAGFNRAKEQLRATVDRHGHFWIVTGGNANELLR